MKFAIITHVDHVQNKNNYYAYAPYVREMNIWIKYVDELIIVAPLSSTKKLTNIDDFYKFENVDFKKIPSFNFITFASILISMLKLPIIFWKIFWAMKESDHIHLRCPGNIGLIGCLVQVFFPRKMKTAKYAGNWDPKAKQPLSYRFQKWILNNSLLTRNMQVLVYGEWEKISNNIKPFFTASYLESEKLPLKELGFKDNINFVFVGSLSSGKNPFYAVKLIEMLFNRGYKVALDLYGEGLELKILENYINTNRLQEYISLKGNQNKKTIIEAYQQNHFVILPSKSEGWPKAIAEGMFWGCVPIATKVSCVPFMLDFGNRGVLLEMKLNEDLSQIENIIKDESVFRNMSKLSSNWSRNYTVDIFENEIKELIIK